MYDAFGVEYCDEDDYLAKTSERDGSKKVDDELNIAWSKNHKSLPLNPADIIIITDSKLEEAYAKFI